MQGCTTSVENVSSDRESTVQGFKDSESALKLTNTTEVIQLPQNIIKKDSSLQVVQGPAKFSHLEFFFFLIKKKCKQENNRLMYKHGTITQSQ